MVKPETVPTPAPALLDGTVLAAVNAYAPPAMAIDATTARRILNVRLCIAVLPLVTETVRSRPLKNSPRPASACVSRERAWSAL